MDRLIAPDLTSRNPNPPHPNTDHPSRRDRPIRQPVTGLPFDPRFHRLIDHLCSLGPRPVGECLLQLIGTNDDARTALIILLEQYRRLDAGVVQAVGGDVFPPAPIHAVADR